MRKAILPIVSLVVVCAISLFFLNNFIKKGYKTANPIHRMEVDENDGRKEADELEFIKTRDIQLGYIPKYKLVNSIQQMQVMAKALKGKRNATSFPNFTWAERGPNADAVGLYNGNTRANNGMTSGRIRAIWVDLADAHKTVWVGGIDGGIWKTSDITSNPASWSMVSDFFTNLSVSSICQDPTNNNVMYFGTGEKTANADHVRGGGVWKSTDHGVTWNFLPNTINFWNVSKMVCDNLGNLYVASMSTNNTGLQRSSDGGASWTDISPSGLNRSITDIELSSTGTLHIVCGYLNNFFGTLVTTGYKYTDHPETVTSSTWISPVTPFPNTQYNVDLAVSGATVYALPSNSSYQTPQVYKSIDGGANWLPTTTSPPANSSNTSLSSGQAWYNIAIAVDQSNPNNVIAGGLNCYTSTDGGATWLNSSTWVGTTGYYVHADQQMAVWTGNQVLVSSDGGIFYSGDGAQTFFDRNNGLRLKQFYSCAIHPTTTNYFLAGAQDNGVHQMSNPGLSSSIEVTGGDGAFVHIDQDEPQYQFGSYVYNNYRRSTDGGISWTPVNYSNGGSFINPFDYDDVGNVMYCGGGTQQFIRWNNPQSGSSFSQVTLNTLSGTSVSCVKVSPYSPNTVYFGGYNGSLVKVTNANTDKITEANLGGPGFFSNVISNIEIGTSEKDMIISVSNYGTPHVWMTNNGGISWTNISGNLPNMPVRWARFFPEDDTKAIIGTELGVWETSLINGSTTSWVNDPSFPIVRTDMIQYRPADGLFAAATHGRGLWTTILPKTIPYVRFANNYSVQSESGATTNGCRTYKDYTLNMNIDLPPSGDANVQLSVNAASTATLGSDFDFTTNGSFTAPSTTLKFLNGSTTPQPVTIRIYDDNEVEGQENIILSSTVSGATNSQVAPSGQNFTFIINDNDQAPAASSMILGGNNISIANETPFKSTDTKYRLQCLFTASEIAAAGITQGTSITSLSLNVLTKGSTVPYNSFAINMANYGASDMSLGFRNPTFTQVYSSNYTTTVGTNLFNFTQAFAWDGVSNILVQFCFDNSTSTAGFSSDVVEGSDSPLFGAISSVYSDPTSTPGSACNLTSFISSPKRIKATFGLSGGANIETLVNQQQNFYIGSNGSFYFYSPGGNIISSVKGAGPLVGCITSNILEVGTTWQPFSGGMRSQKIIDMNAPSNTNPSYNIGLYYTAAELGGIAPSNVKIAVTNATSGSAANSANSLTLQTTYKTFGAGYIFSAATNKFARFFLVFNPTTLPVSLLSFTGKLNNNNALLTWQTSEEHGSKSFEIEKSTDGNKYEKIGTIAAKGNSSITSSYEYTDNHLFETNYYRLKMIDGDGKFTYSQVVVIKSGQTEQKVWILNNPFTNAINVGIRNLPKKNITVQLYDLSGNMIFNNQYAPVNSLFINLTSKTLSNGVYVLKVQADETNFATKVVKQ